MSGILPSNGPAEDDAFKKWPVTQCAIPFPKPSYLPKDVTSFNTDRPYEVIFSQFDEFFTGRGYCVNNKGCVRVYCSHPSEMECMLNDGSMVDVSIYTEQVDDKEVLFVNIHRLFGDRNQFCDVIRDLSKFLGIVIPGTKRVESLPAPVDETRQGSAE
jgi:hypothetical protein